MLRGPTNLANSTSQLFKCCGGRGSLETLSLLLASCPIRMRSSSRGNLLQIQTLPPLSSESFVSVNSFSSAGGTSNS